MQGNKGFPADFRIKESFGYSTALDNSFDYPHISGSLERSTLAVIAKRSAQNLYGRVILQACSY